MHQTIKYCDINMFLNKQLQIYHIITEFADVFFKGNSCLTDIYFKRQLHPNVQLLKVGNVIALISDIIAIF